MTVVITIDVGNFDGTYCAEQKINAVGKSNSFEEAEELVRRIELLIEENMDELMGEIKNG